MLSNARSWLLASTVIAALGVSAAAQAQEAGSEERGGCPVTHQALTRALRAAVAEVGSNNMWASVVNRDGVVCAVTFSGRNRGDQFPVSRAISVAKAFTANGVSLPGAPLSTAQLYPLT